MMSAAALVLLWARRSSALDLWLAVAACALTAELATVSFILVTRYSLGFYLGRIFSVAVSTTVLIMLLVDTTGLYRRFSRANTALQRKRENHLLKMEAAVFGIADKIRQPLTSISIRAAAARNYLERQPNDIDQVQRIVHEMENAGYRANDIFESVLARVNSSDFKRQLVDINEITRDAFAALRKPLDDHGIVTTLNLVSDLPLISGQRRQLRYVVCNLIKNSIEAMSVGTAGGGRNLIVATARHDSDDIVISVEDTGPGINDQMMDKIFDAFFTTKQKRLGLGLAVSRMIVERCGGRISASQGSGGGARFQVTLPSGGTAPR